MKWRANLYIVLVIGLLVSALKCAFAIAQEPTPEAAVPQGFSRPAETTAPSARSGGPQEVVQRAIVYLESLRSIQAQTRQYVSLFGKELVGAGVYLEQRTPNGLELRLELRMQRGDETSTLLQVCDRRYLWLCRDKESPVRIDVVQVARALEERGDLPQPGRIGPWPGLGGLPKLLRGLNANFDFTSIEETRLGQQLPAYQLQGVWKQEKLCEIIPEEAGAVRAGKPVNLDKIPPHLPHYVVLFLEKENLFLRRIEYRRRPSTQDQQQGRAGDQTIVSMDLRDVVLNAPINPAQFVYSPGNREFTDQTDRFLEGLGLKKK